MYDFFQLKSHFEGISSSSISHKSSENHCMSILKKLLHLSLLPCLQGAASSPVDQLKCSMRLEMQDVLNPMDVWIVQILENVGGRLYLRLEGTESASKHFWMYYLNPRLHYVGWAAEQEYTYKPPQGEL